jgi:hypothetical protein
MSLKAMRAITEHGGCLRMRTCMSVCIGQLALSIHVMNKCCSMSTSMQCMLKSNKDHYKSILKHFLSSIFVNSRENRANGAKMFVVDINKQ